MNGVTATLGGTSDATVKAGGHRFTASEAGNSLILKDGHSTLTLQDGSQTIFEGQTISAGRNGGVIVVNGKKTIKVTASAHTTGMSGYITSGLGGKGKGKGSSGHSSSPSSNVQAAATQSSSNAAAAAIGAGNPALKRMSRYSCVDESDPSVGPSRCIGAVHEAESHISVCKGTWVVQAAQV